MFSLRLATTTTCIRRARRTISTVRLVESTATRSLALPLCFVSLKGYEPSSSTSSPDFKREWISKFSEKGYSSIIVEIDPTIDSITSSKTSKQLLSSLETEFISLLSSDSLTSSPFPPLLFSSGPISSYLTQSYVSSNPLSGLLLYKPLPLDQIQNLFPLITTNSNNDVEVDEDLKEFDFEPFFPVAVVTSSNNENHNQVEEIKEQEENFRLIKGLTEEEEEDGFVKRIKEGNNDLETWEKVMNWMDENGL
ncbi:hypothetical protein JCM3765_000965 [Sporobolomyces pararoseus]